MILDLKRVPNWRVRLGGLVSSLMRMEFVWGEADCVSKLGFPVIEALTGENLRPAVPAYSDPEGAKRALQVEGVQTIAEWLEARFLEWVDEEGNSKPAKARVGDLAIIPTELGIGEGLGFYTGERIGVLTPKGYGTILRSPAYRSFKIG